MELFETLRWKSQECVLGTMKTMFWRARACIPGQMSEMLALVCFGSQAKIVRPSYEDND